MDEIIINHLKSNNIQTLKVKDLLQTLFVDDLSLRMHVAALLRNQGYMRIEHPKNNFYWMKKPNL